LPLAPAQPKRRAHLQSAHHNSSSISASKSSRWRGAISAEERIASAISGDLKTLYARAGYELSTRELPDYLPVVLEHLSCRDLREARELLSDCAHILRRIGQSLIARGAAMPPSCRHCWSLPVRRRLMPLRYLASPSGPITLTGIGSSSQPSALNHRRRR